MLLMMIAMATLAGQDRPITRDGQPCVPQPMPLAIESAGSPPIASDMIEFAATPALDYPGRAWVVRISRRGEAEAAIEIVRLRRQFECNRYDIENRWQSALRQDEYRAIAARVVPVGVPAPGVFVPPLKGQLPELGMDGTAISLRLTSLGWQVTRRLNHYGNDGVTISAIFREIASRYVPGADLPTEDWRTVAGLKKGGERSTR